MSQLPLISVITVSFNSEKTIGQTLQSLREQTSRNFESIVIDGGSTDKTMDIVASYNDVVTTSISEKDDGIYHAMNKGIALAKGKYIAFLNSDDFYFPDTIQSVTSFAERLDPDVIYGDMQKSRTIDHHLFTRIEKPNLDKMPKEMGIFHPATFVKREVFEQLGGFDLRFKLAADYHFLLRAYLKNFNFEYLEKTLVNFSIGGVSNFSCRSYAECITILTELNTGYADEMKRLYGKCKRKMLKQRIISGFIFVPLIRNLYMRRIKKHW